MAKARVKVPKTAAAGEIITIKTLISHRMESGQRTDAETGELIPRKIINKFSCEFNGKTVFSCDIDLAIPATPFLQFNARVQESGPFNFTWTDDDGTVTEATRDITVS